MMLFCFWRVPGCLCLGALFLCGWGGTNGGTNGQTASEQGTDCDFRGEDGQISGRKRFFFGIFRKITCLKLCGMLN